MTMLFSGRHSWVRLMKPCSRTNSKQIRAAIGLTQRGLDDMAEVLAWRKLTPAGHHVEAGTPLASLDWYGYHISEADELYHTTWDAVEGTSFLSSPIPGTFDRINSDALDSVASGTLTSGHHDLLAETWLAEMIINEEVAASLLKGGAGALMDADAYTAYVEAECDSPQFPS